MAIRTRLFALPAALVLLATGCGKDSTGNGGNGGILDSGKLSFTYAGDFAGTFSAEGAIPAQGQAGATWAMAEHDAETDEINVWANVRRADGKVNQIILEIPDSGAGQYTIRDDGEGEAWVQIHFGLALTSPVTEEHLCEITTGVVNVASMTDEEIRGSFSGTATCLDESMEEELTIQITNGQFETPVYED